MKISNIIFIALFIACISSFGVVWILNIAPEPIPIKERKRQNVELNELHYSNLSTYLQNKIDDNIPFRTHIITAFVNIWEERLASINKHNVKGKNGHYFNMTRINPPIEISKKEINNFVNLLTGYSIFFKLNNVNFIFTVPPSKERAMPNYLPNWAKSYFVDEILAAVKANKFIPYFDLSEAIIKHQNNEKTYNKHYDINHWNGYGLSVAIEALSDNLSNYNKIYDYKNIKDKFEIIEVEKVAGVFAKEKVTLLNIINIDNLTANETNLDNLEGWTHADHITNSERDNGSFVILTDSYFKDAAQVNHFKEANGSILPFTYAVKDYLHMHYGPAFSNVYKRIVNEYKPDTLVLAVTDVGLEGYSKQIDPYFQILADTTLNNAHKFLTKENVSDNFMVTTNDLGEFYLSAKILSNVADNFTIIHDKKPQTWTLFPGENYIRIVVEGEPNSKVNISIPNIDFNFQIIEELNVIKERYL